MDFTYYLQAQLLRHPAMQPQDIVKMCYQAAFGAEHLLADPAEASRQLAAEFDAVPAASGPLYEALSDEVGRIYLDAWKARGLPLRWLQTMFLQSARICGQGQTQFEAYLAAAQHYLAQHPANFSAAQWEQYLSQYRQSGITPVHHSQAYRDAEQPAYRIVRQTYQRLLPVLERIVQLRQPDPVCVIAIDGRAASGKTTLADQLSSILGAEVVRMDDFFLPAALRTDDRLSTPGGNIHSERFAQEVLPYIRKPYPFSYRVFDCGILDYRSEKALSAGSIRIVEGSYSCHPIFGAYADLKVFSSVSPEEQQTRIRQRNGEVLLRMFCEKWIPMEEAYFRHFAIAEAADLIL